MSVTVGTPEVLRLDFEAESARNTVYVRLHEMLTHKRTGKPVARRKIGNNTYAERVENQFGKPAIAVRLHSTHVVIHTRDTVTLNTGGWHTVTTKDRINSWCGAGIHVYSDRGTWMVTYGNAVVGNDRWESVPFHDNIVLHHKGDHWGLHRTTQVRSEVNEHNIVVRKRVKAWLDVMPKRLSEADEDLPKFSVECVSCVPTDPTHNIGDSFGNQEHLLQHMLRGEYPHRLIDLGCREIDEATPGVRWQSTDAAWKEAHRTVTRALRHAVLTRLLTGVVVVARR